MFVPGCRRSAAMPEAPHPRIVSIAPAVTSLLFQMGLGDHVVGVSSYCRLPAGQTRPVVGDALNIRAQPILQTEPDIVIAQLELKHFEPIKQIRPDLRIERFTIERLDDIPAAMERLGVLTGKLAVGKKAAADFRGKLADVTRQTASLPKPTVLFALGFEDLSSAGRGTFIDDMVTAAGGTNILHDSHVGWVQPTSKTVIDARPEIVFCQCMPGRAHDARRYWSNLGRGQGWPRRIEVVEDADWSMPAGHLAAYTARLAKVLHGEALWATTAPADKSWLDVMDRVILYRILAAAAVGMALATGGLALQGLMRNPLAEPYLLGISSGAGVGVLLGGSLAVATVLPSWLTTPALAMAAALATAAIVYGIAQRRGRLDPYVLLLSGVIVNVFNGALILVILQFVKQEEMIAFIGWGMGKIPEYLWFRPWLLAVCWAMVLGGWACLMLRSSALNALGLGDEVAASSGVNVHRLRIEIFTIVALMTAAAVALAGPIGFVGLIVPHLCRMVLGPDHRRLMIVSAVAGALFLIGADTLCRWADEVSRHGELPVGVVTAMAGGPFFIFLLRRRGRRGEL
ncbi:MAG: iron chelate uptake ABC transporter family permease subunit [Planctomycetaceae bacterium]|nr:iron chelate uptake ABC transporter family permease subunit [Planctomycetaceae bacterium]